MRLVSSLAFILVPCSLSAATSTDPSLIPNIFAPESTPAHSIHHVSLFVLAISAGIFAVVFGLMIYAAIRFRRRSDDDGREPPQCTGTIRGDRVDDGAIFDRRGAGARDRARDSRSPRRADTAGGARRECDRASMVVGDSLSGSWAS